MEGIHSCNMRAWLALRETEAQNSLPRRLSVLLLLYVCPLAYTASWASQALSSTTTTRRKRHGASVVAYNRSATFLFVRPVHDAACMNELERVTRRWRPRASTTGSTEGVLILGWGAVIWYVWGSLDAGLQARTGGAWYTEGPGVADVRVRCGDC